MRSPLQVGKLRGPWGCGSARGKTLFDKRAPFVVMRSNAPSSSVRFLLVARSLSATFSLSCWNAKVGAATSCQPLWPASWRLVVGPMLFVRFEAPSGLCCWFAAEESDGVELPNRVCRAPVFNLEGPCPLVLLVVSGGRHVRIRSLAANSALIILIPLTL